MGGMLLWIASIMTAAIGVFWLPWHCASSIPVPGESYVFGFNNKVGILALGAAIFIALLARLICGRPQTSQEWLNQRPLLFPDWGEGKSEYAILAAWSAIWGILLLSWGSFLVDPAWCESRQHYYDLNLMALGQVPYRDFMYNYGPAMLYLPFWLSTFTGGCLSFEQGYLTILILFTLLGFIAVFLFIRSLAIPARQRPFILFLALLAWGEISMGLQYTPIRFFIVPASLILLNAVVETQKSGAPKGEFLVMLGSAGGSFACLAISPEMGIAGLMAMLAYGFALALAGAQRRALACWVGCLLMAGITMLVFPQYLLSVVAFASGGSNFPIYPNIHNVALVGMALITLPALIASAFKAPHDSRSPLALGLAVGGGMLLPVAFGRSDPGHVFFNSTIPALLMFAAAARAGLLQLRCWMWGYTLLYIILVQYSYWGHYYYNFVGAAQMRAFYEREPALVASWKEQWDWLRLNSPHGKNFHWSSVLPFPKELEQFADKGALLLTSGNEGNMWLARYLALQKKVPNDFFHAYSQGAVTPSQIQKRGEDASHARFLITPESDLAPLAGAIDLSAYQRGANGFLSRLLLFPVNSEVRNPPYLPDAEFAKSALRDYSPVARFQNYIILEKKTTDHAK
jgi:hypothetical protein